MFRDFPRRPRRPKLDGDEINARHGFLSVQVVTFSRGLFKALSSVGQAEADD